MSVERGAILHGEDAMAAALEPGGGSATSDASRHAVRAPAPRSEVAVVMRLCYTPDHDRVMVEWRFSFFEKVVLPFIQRQTHPVDVWLWVHPYDMDRARGISGVHPFTVDLEAPSREFEETTIRGYPWSAVQGMPKYPYQVLFGSDDIIAPTFIGASMVALRGLTGNSALVTHHPLMLNWQTKTCHLMPKWPHRPSPFVVLRQRTDRPDFQFIWDQPHTHLHKVVRRWRYFQPGLAFMVTHDYNDGTRFDEKYARVKTPEWLAEPLGLEPGS